MAALDRALTLAEHVDVAMLIAEDLELDVPRTFDEFLEVKRIVSQMPRVIPQRAVSKIARTSSFELQDVHSSPAAPPRSLQQAPGTRAPRPS